MAKRKTKRSKGGRRRRVGAIGGAGIMDVAAIAVGVGAGNTLVAKFAPANLDAKIVSGAQVLIGLLLAKKTKGAVSNVAKGVAVGGAYNLVKSLAPGIVSGIGAPLVKFSNSSLGFPQQPVIHGPGVNMHEMSVISGRGMNGMSYNYQ